MVRARGGVCLIPGKTALIINGAVPSARTIARLLTISRDLLSKSETITVAAIEDQVPLLVEAREIIAAP
jgi:hypothetical protein